MKQDLATQRQITAADPGVSTWLSANAGSGKTRVLIDRVVRLLLDETSPQNILCLTYTKAAASEMQNRLFLRLGEWSMMNDTDLTQELTKLGAPIPGCPDRLAYARTLFARAIDTPGGLRIQTIHSFCASLLRRFPLEARVSPLFREIDERTASRLRTEVIEEMASGENAGCVRDIANYYSGDDFEKLAAEAIKHQEISCRQRNDEEIWTQFGLRPGFNDMDLISNVFIGNEVSLFKTLLPILNQSSKVSDRNAATSLRKIDPAKPKLSDLILLFSVFLFGAKTKAPFTAKLSAFPTKDIRNENPELIDILGHLMTRVEQVRELFNQLMAARKTKSFIRFAPIFLSLYTTKKSERGWLDFDDLILKAQNLLSDPEVAQWVLFRLDGGLDHILVDEAQDTSPAQWKVVELLTQEFGVGLGARPDSSRTIFVVGDLKQSIYSFQGADPQAFDKMCHHFEYSLDSTDQQLSNISLEHSFRSSPAILNLVDSVFHETGGRGVGGIPKHLAFQNNMPGRVDLWDVVEKSKGDDEKEWYDPTDKVLEHDHRIILAENIADNIQDMVDSGSIPDDSGSFRRIQYQDILILVQRRSELFHQIIRACKNRNLPIAGADRLKIGAETAVNDLRALMSFLDMPGDSLSLAVALRSPLFSLKESELFDLAHARPEKDLWLTLIRRQNTFKDAFDILSELRDQVDYLSPYELIERILTRHSGRERLLGRLGPEAEDGIDALLSLALSYESIETPSLTGFLMWLESDGTEIKRQAENASDQIRVMTTHGAKGMESPIVILPDTGERRNLVRNEILSDGKNIMWRSTADTAPDMMRKVLVDEKNAQSEELQRLMYVALTRAEKWLIVCASGEIKDDGESWYRLVKSGMVKAEAAEFNTPTGPGLRLQHGKWKTAKPDQNQSESQTAINLPDWIAKPVVIPPTEQKTVSPSEFDGDKSLAGEVDPEASDNALNHGRQLHKLLEYLPRYPRTAWPEITRQLLYTSDETVTEGKQLELLEKVSAILSNSDFSHIFGPDALAEADISANFGARDGYRIRGSIDRLVITDGTVLIVDFKSNRVVPDQVSDTPIGILRQMSAYLDAIEQIYPDHEINLAILWTTPATLMTLPHDIVRRSYQQPLHLDVAGL